MNKGKLYLIPTVISPDTQGKVISPQVADTIHDLSLFIVENVRSARRFISSLKLGLVIEDLEFFELNKNTELDELYDLMQGLNKGQSIGVLSESGCPGVADPGALAVEIAHNMGIRVIPLVGPSSILMTIMASGLNGQTFAFRGYLPIADRERQTAIRDLEQESLKYNSTQLFIETPYRNLKLLNAIIKTCKPTTRLCVACDITGTSEMIKTQSIEKWRKAATPELHKLPTVFAILA